MTVEPARRPRRLGLLISAVAVSNFADGIGKTAFPLLAASLTRDPVLIGGLAATQFLPWLLFSLVSGVVLDRIDRRKAVIAANTVRAVVVGGLAVLVAVDAASIWLTYVAAMLIGTAETLADSAANVLIPAVAGRDELDRANGRLQAGEVVGQAFLGPLAGGFAFALFAAFPFLLNSIGFALAAVLLLAMTGRYRPAETQARGSLRADTRVGIGWVRKSPIILRLMLVAAAASLTSELAASQLVLYVLDDLRLTEALFGVFAGLSGVGGLLGAVVAPRLVVVTSRRTVLIGGLGVAGASVALMGLMTNAVIASALFGVYAVAVVAVNVVIGTVRHRVVPDELLGRVLGVWRTVVWGAIPVGALLGGVLTRLFDSASGTFAVSGVLQLAVAGCAFVVLRRFGGELTAGTPRSAGESVGGF